MADNKKSVLLYCDLIHTVEKLDNETAGELFKHYLRYVNDLDPVTYNPMVDVVFESIKQNLKRDLKKWEETKEGKSTSGSLGNLKRWHLDLYNDVISKKKTLEESLSIAKHRTAIKPIANIAVKDTVTVKDKVIDIKEKKPKTVFVPPSKKEFMVFARSKFKTEELYQASRDKLLLKYDAWTESDWINGRTDKKIKKWKSVLLNTIPYL